MKSDREDYTRGKMMTSDSGGGVHLVRPQRPTVIKGAPVADSPRTPTPLPDLAPLKERLDRLQARIEEVKRNVRA